MVAKGKTTAKVKKDDSKDEALANAIARIEKQFGKGSIMRLGEAAANMNVEVIPTGILSLDAALGVGGVPRGRIVEIYGPESSGKTTLALHLVAQTQKMGGTAAFIDAEHALDPVYASHLGVNIDNLLISQPDTGEQALEIAEALVRSAAVDAVVIDSVAALVPQSELEGEMGDMQVGMQARLMSKALRKITGAVSRSNCLVVFINQIRAQINKTPYGGPTETTAGGRALKFYASVRLDVRRIGGIKKGDEQIGNRVKIKVAKNKVAPPFKQVEVDIMFGKGMSNEGSLLDMATQMKIIKKSGSWFSYEGERIGQGRENVKIYLDENPEIANEVEQKVRAALVQENPLNIGVGMAEDEIEKPAAAKIAEMKNEVDELGEMLDDMADYE